MTDNDEDLRNRFSALRLEEEEQAPSFKIPSRPIRGRSYGGLKIVAFAACLAVGIAAVVWWQEPAFKTAQEKFVAPSSSITTWRAPTEFLLDIPGGELLRTVPAFGVSVGHGNASEPGQKRRKHAQGLVKKSGTAGNRRLRDPAGARVLFIRLGLSARLKSCPVTKRLDSSLFSASCEVVSCQKMRQKRFSTSSNKVCLKEERS